MPANPITPLGLSVLAVLREGPTHPYDTLQIMTQRQIDSIVKLRPGSLYHAFNRLEDQGFITQTGVDRDGNRPERTTYELTPTGSAALRERIGEMLSRPADAFPEFPLAITEAHNLPRSTVITLLRERVTELATTVAAIEDKVRDYRLREVPRLYWVGADFRRNTLRAELDWLTALLTDLTNSTIPWPEPGENYPVGAAGVPSQPAAMEYLQQNRTTP